MSVSSVHLGLEEKPRLKTTTLSDQFGTFLNVRWLAQLGCRPKLVQVMTGAPMPVIRETITRIHGTCQDSGGRLPRKIAAIIKDVHMHIHASVFLKHYSAIVAHYSAVRGDFHTDSYIRALGMLQDVMPGTPFTPDHAMLVANAYHSGEVVVQSCLRPQCPAQYLSLKTPELVRSQCTRGECPLCRSIAARSSKRTDVNIRSEKALRVTLARLAS
jgi:hypothetical protein